MASSSHHQSSRSRAKQSSSSHDRYYGYRETAEFCEFVVSALFPVAKAEKSSSSRSQQSDPSTSASAEYPRRPGVDTPPTSPDPAKGKSTDEAKSPIPLGEFVAYALYRTRLSQPITYIALVLLTRLKALYPSARGTPTSPHRLFLSSLMLASKITMDDTYSNKSWAIVGSDLWDVKEVNQMERELFAFLGWNVVVQPEELDEWERVWGAQWTQRRRKRRAEREARERESREREAERHRRAKQAAEALLAQRNQAAAEAGAPVPPPQSTSTIESESEEIEQLASHAGSSSRSRSAHSTSSSRYRSNSDVDSSASPDPSSSSSAPSSSPSNFSATPYSTSSVSSYGFSHHPSHRRPSASSSRGPDSEYYGSDAETDVSASTSSRPRWARPRGRDTPATPITPSEEGLRTPEGEEEEIAANPKVINGAGDAEDDVDMHSSVMAPGGFATESKKQPHGGQHGAGAAVRWLGNVVRGWSEHDDDGQQQHHHHQHHGHGWQATH